MTAKLEELKKLKVPELKSQLKKLGLDCRGLKAELVGRLWSAVNGGLDSKESNDTSKPHLTCATEARAVSPPLPTRREYTDTGTQTDTDSRLAAVPGDTSPELESREEKQKRKSNEDTIERRKNPRTDGKGKAFYEFKEEIRYKRSKLPALPVTEEIVEKDESTVKIDSYNSHLHFEVEPDGTSGHPRYWEQFPLLWSGCRLTHGVQQNRVGFEVRLERLLISNPQDQKDDTNLNTFGLRVGWSAAGTSLMLGNGVLSFAFDWRGKKVSQGREDDYGQPLSVGDIIGCYASFSSDGAVELSFHKNGFFMGIAFTLDASELQGQPLFPHVVCRCCSVRFLLDPLSRPWYPSPPGFTSLIALADELKICSISAPLSKSQSEVILMVGLPGSGKTHWAKNHIKQHPEKHYQLLNIDELLSCMTTNVERDITLPQASQCLTELIKLAAKRPGNYILDQCNVLFSARQYKLQLFLGFRHKVMVVFPSKVEWQRRLSMHQISEGEQIPQAALLKLQVSCTLPQPEDLIDELQYVELPQQQSQTVLQEYKDEARRLLPPVPKHNKKPPRYNKKSCPHHPSWSYKIKCASQNGWNNLQSWSQPQIFWPATFLQEHYNNSSYNYQSYW